MRLASAPEVVIAPEFKCLAEFGLPWPANGLALRQGQIIAKGVPMQVTALESCAPLEMDVERVQDCVVAPLVVRRQRDSQKAC